MKKSIFVLWMLFSAFLSYAQQSNVREEFEHKLSKASIENKTIQSKFKQVKKVVGLKNEIVSGGDFSYDNSGLMALVYDSPAGDKVIMRDEEFTIVAGGKIIESNSSDNPMIAQISYMMQASMSGDIAKFGQGWELSINKNETEYIAIIKPLNRRVKRYILTMTMIFDQKTMTLNELRIDETQGGFTSYKFLSKEINKDIDNKVFML